MTVTAIPILTVDIIGAVILLVFSVLAIAHARNLSRRDPENLLWTFLLWLCVCLGVLFIFRAAGRILEHALFQTGDPAAVEYLRSLTGEITMVLLVVAAAFILFFNRTWNIFRHVFAERKMLRQTRKELMALNRTLEERVQERTDTLLKHEKQMARADRLASIGQLSSGIAHEINNPLGVIQGYTQLLMRDEDSGSQRYQDLQVILKHAKNCKAIVEDLRSFARRSTPEKTETSINDVIRDAVLFVQTRVRKQNIRIDTCLDDAVVPMYMDEKKIRQVLVNLIMNACQAVGENGVIEIRTELDVPARQVRISVSDDGCGIEEKNIERIFDPFFTTKPTGEGTGLGLAVSYGIVRNNGGEILVSSEPGRGSEFTVVLPVISARNASGDF